MENEGKIICDKCEGTGYQSEKKILWFGGFGYEDAWCYTCSKCHGEGSLFWIDYIMGGKKGEMKIDDKDVIVGNYKQTVYRRAL